MIWSGNIYYSVNIFYSIESLIPFFSFSFYLFINIFFFCYFRKRWITCPCACVLRKKIISEKKRVGVRDVFPLRKIISWRQAKETLIRFHFILFFFLTKYDTFLTKFPFSSLLILPMYTFIYFIFIQTKCWTFFSDIE